MAYIYRAKYKVKKADGTVETRTCRNWTLEWRDLSGQLHRENVSPDKRIATIRQAAVEQSLLREEHDVGVQFDPKPIGEHIDAYLQVLESDGRDDQYVYIIGARLRKLVAACGWGRLRDISPDAFIRWRVEARKPVADGLKRGPGRMAAAMSARTLNQYLETAISFTNWCAMTKRMPGIRINAKKMISTALAGVEKAAGDVVRKRRALSDEQVAALLAACVDDRRLVYRLALSSGLRRQELVDLQWGDVRLTAIPAYLELRPGKTKNRKGGRLELPGTLAQELRSQRPEGVRPLEPVFPAGVPTIDQWREDLAAAGIPYKDDQGRQVDFHAGTRKTLCTRLHRHGVPLAAAMRRMRHSAAKLTLVDYTDESQLDSSTLPEIEAAAPQAAKEEQA
jgi:integrase